MSKTYQQLSAEGLRFLAECGKLTLAERQMYEDDGGLSANEALGMATRILAEQSKIMQAVADAQSEPTTGGEK